MRFAVMRKADPETEAGVMPSEELIVAMGRYHEELVNAGVLKGGDGLKPSALGVRVKFSGGKPTVIDGPFTETKELVAGFSIWEVASREEAVEWARRWPTIDGHGQVELEIRPIWDMVEFGDGEGIDLHLELRERISRAG